MIRVGILGATGYTGLEALEWLLRHPKVQIVAATSRQANGNTLSDAHPRLVGRLKLLLEDLTPELLNERCDVVFSCLPHGASAHRITQLLKLGCKVIDLSPDYRLSDAALYQSWYGEKHPEPTRLGNTPYGLPELFADQLHHTQLIANPGSYATSAILPLAPLLKEKLIDPDDVIVDSIGSWSTEGRLHKFSNLFCEASESITTLSIGSHRELPEMVDVLHRFAGAKPRISFTPHLVPAERGILSTLYVRPRSGVTPNQLRECLHTYYYQTSFVRVVSHLPNTRFVHRTNYVDISVRENGDRITLVCALDNLVKGAAGAAIQNMNYMFSLDPTLGLVP